MQVGVDASMMVDNKRVFVVERDEITRAVLQFILHDENETHELASLEDAYAKGAEWRPDLVVLGQDFLRTDGPGVVVEVARRLNGARILVVAESATDALALDCVKAGAAGALIKPLTVESVRHKVDIALGRKAAAFVPLHLLSAR
jgi:DNA-binding NtrC family response regulator